jgi:hypothetical protein
MKSKIHYILFLALSTLTLSCEKDNFDAPKASLTGQLVYNGEAIGLEYNKVNYELYQPGFGKTGPIGSTFTPEGGFSHLLFDGNYKLVIPLGQGPFVWKQSVAGKPDSLAVTLSGNTNVNIEVTPYFMIRNALLSYSAASVTGTCKLEQIVTGVNAKTIERVTLYISKTRFADSQTNIATAQIAGAAITDLNNVVLKVTVPVLVPTQNYVFARIGVKFSGVDDMIFAATTKLTL